MREAPMYCRPTKMQMNSRPNRRPTSSPGRNEPSLSNRRWPRPRAQMNTRRAANVERKPTCRMGLMPAKVSFTATCCMPQMTPSKVMVAKAAGPGGRRSFMGSHRAATAPAGTQQHRVRTADHRSTRRWPISTPSPEWSISTPRRCRQQHPSARSSDREWRPLRRWRR